METQKLVGTVKLEGDYAATILSYYLWGKAEAPKFYEIADEKFIRPETEPDEASLKIGIDAKEYMDKIGNNIILSRQRMFQLLTKFAACPCREDRVRQFGKRGEALSLCLVWRCSAL